MMVQEQLEGGRRWRGMHRGLLSRSLPQDHDNDDGNSNIADETGWQEAAWKDVECAVGVLQSKLWLLASPVEMWDELCIQNMVISCIILHKMMVQEQLEGGEKCVGDYFQEGLPQDHDNDDGNSNIADETEDCH